MLFMDDPSPPSPSPSLERIDQKLTDLIEDVKEIKEYFRNQLDEHEKRIRILENNRIYGKGFWGGIVFICSTLGAILSLLISWIAGVWRS